MRVAVKYFFPCEEVVGKYLPAMRAGIAKKLSKKGFTQERIAHELGLTQPAVSKYLSNNYGAGVKNLEKHPLVEKACVEIADKIASGAFDSRQIATAICTTCALFNSEIESCNVLTSTALAGKAAVKA